MNWEIGTDIYIVLKPCIKQVTHESTYCTAQGSLLNALGDLRGRENPKKREYIYICIVDSLYCRVETNSTL